LSEDIQRTRLRHMKQDGGMRVADQYLHSIFLNIIFIYERL